MSPHSWTPSNDLVELPPRKAPRLDLNLRRERDWRIGTGPEAETAGVTFQRRINRASTLRSNARPHLLPRNLVAITPRHWNQRKPFIPHFDPGSLPPSEEAHIPSLFKLTVHRTVVCGVPW